MRVRVNVKTREASRSLSARRAQFDLRPRSTTRVTLPSFSTGLDLSYYLPANIFYIHFSRVHTFICFPNGFKMYEKWNENLFAVSFAP